MQQYTIRQNLNGRSHSSVLRVLHQDWRRQNFIFGFVRGEEGDLIIRDVIILGVQGDAPTEIIKFGSLKRHWGA
jgi:hypothetical protein